MSLILSNKSAPFFCKKTGFYNKNTRAFSLLEVLVSSSILAMLMAGAWYLYNHGLMTVGSQQVKSEIITDVRRCLNHFENDYRGARIITGTTSETLVSLSEDKIIFTRYFEGDDDMSHYQTITYEFGKYSQGWGLYRKTVDSLKPDSTSFKALIVFKNQKIPGAGREDVGLLTEYTFGDKTEKSCFVGRPAGFNPFIDFTLNPVTSDPKLVHSLEMRLIVKDANDKVRLFRTHVYPRAVVFY
jgi:prepilin-type N-terminal cleavage/methylation domain-containing protein